MNTTFEAHELSSHEYHNTGSKGYDIDYRALYIACEVVNSFLIILTSYILICLVAYGLKTNKWKRSHRKSDVNGGLVYSASVVAVALTLPRYIVNQVLFNAHYIPNGLDYCEVILDIGNVCYFAALYVIYVFLWLRQKALYGHPAMKKLAGKYLAVFSWVTFFVLSGAALGVVLWFVIPDDYTYNFTGCVVSIAVADDSVEIEYQTDYFVLVGLLVAAQISLLGLFIYPMVRSNAIQNLRRASRQSNVNVFVYDTGDGGDAVSTTIPSRVFAYIRQTSRKFSTTSNGKSNTVQKTIRRSVICAAISMLSDIVSMVVASMILPKDLPRSVHNTVYDISILVSAVCILASFRGYKKILSVWCGSAESSLDKSSNSADDSRRYSEKSQSLTV